MDLTQRRKAAKKNIPTRLLRLCAFAPLREVLFFVGLAAGTACLAGDPFDGNQASEKPIVAPAPPAFAEPADESSQYVATTLVKGLDNPWALAVRPGLQAEGAYELYFSESGAGRVVRLSTDKPAETSPAVTGFPLGDFGSNPAYRVGPLGLAFITRTKLAVGTGGLGPGKDVVKVYSLPEDGSVLAYDKPDHAVGPVKAGSRSATGEGSFTSLAKTEDALFATARGDESQGWILKASIEANAVSDLQPFIASRPLVGAAAPTAAVINPKVQMHYLVVGQAGEPSASRDSLIAFYSPASGNLAMSLATGLYDVTALAYSPSGDLYAADFAAAKPNEGGVYRIDAAEVEGRQSCRAVKIAAVTHPTALAFTPDGVLYVTTLGDHTSPSAPPTGALQKIIPGFNTPGFNTPEF